VTPGIDSLASSDANGGDWRNTAIIGGPLESDGALAMGFFDIPDTAVERWKAGRRNDAIVIPIIFNYRHGIELALKAGIREAPPACVTTVLRTSTSRPTRLTYGCRTSIRSRSW
jgi:hypothetical protein